jgi:hypothetical protein
MHREIQVTAGRIEVTCIGAFGQAELLETVDAIEKAQAGHPGLRKCFMDASGAEFTLAGIAEFFVGEYAAKRLGGMRISVLIGPGRQHKLLENAAYNRGLRILFSHSRDAAETWLLS